MSDNTKRGERKDKENTIWTRRIEREFYKNNRKYVEMNDNCVKEAKTPEDLKNSKYGEMLKHTNNITTKDCWKDAVIKNNNKKERFNSRIEIDNSIMSYEEMKQTSIQQIEELRNKLSKCNDEIFVVENLLKELPERLEGLKDLKKEIESEICWLQYGDN